MTDQPPERDPDDEIPDPSLIPTWIPVLIGVILAAMAAFAVWTGLRYRETTMRSYVRPRVERAASNAPPGEPGAGASHVVHGKSGETTPTASAPVTGRSRAEITGGPGGVQAVVRMWARRGMVLNVMPEDAMVFVNDLPIGQVRQFNTLDEVYDFAEPGSYTVRIVAAGAREKTFVVTATNDAKEDVARISANLLK